MGILVHYISRSTMCATNIILVGDSQCTCIHCLTRVHSRPRLTNGNILLYYTIRYYVHYPYSDNRGTCAYTYTLSNKGIFYT